jgi:hypothetical protein
MEIQTSPSPERPRKSTAATTPLSDATIGIVTPSKLLQLRGQLGEPQHCAAQSHAELPAFDLPATMPQVMQADDSEPEHGGVHREYGMKINMAVVEAKAQQFGEALPTRYLRPVADTVERLRQHFEAQKQLATSKAWQAHLPTSHQMDSPLTPGFQNSLNSTPTTCAGAAPPYSYATTQDLLADRGELEFHDGECNGSIGADEEINEADGAKLAQCFVRLSTQLDLLEEILDLAEPIVPEEHVS